MDPAVKRHIELKEREQRAYKLTQELVDLVNVMGNEDQLRVCKGISAGLTHSHRTLQQNFCRNLRDTLAMYAMTTSVDARNEDAVKWAAAAGSMSGKMHFI